MGRARGALAGGLGFGAGWFLAGVAGDAMLIALVLGAAVGGAALALGAGLWSSDRRRFAWATAASALGFGIGFFVGFFIVIAAWDPTSIVPYTDKLLIGLVGGGLGGGALGLATRVPRAALSLALAGAVGFGVGMQLVDAAWPEPVRGPTCCTLEQSLMTGAHLALSGIIGGATVGAAYGAMSQAPRMTRDELARNPRA